MTRVTCLIFQTRVAFVDESLRQLHLYLFTVYKHLSTYPFHLSLTRIWY